MAPIKKYALLCSLLLLLLPTRSKAQASADQTQAPGQTRTSGQTQTTSGQTQAPGQTRTSGKAQSLANTPASAATQPPTDSSAFTLLDSLFRRPEFLYETIGPDIPADMQPILIKFNNAIAANRAWFLQYRNTYPSQTLPYDPHFGITADEYRRVLRLQAAPPPLVPIDSQSVAVLKDGGFIHFKSSGENHLLDYLYIDPTHRVLEYGGDTIPFAGPSAAGKNSRFGQWQGFTWHLERVQSLAPPEDPLLPTDPQKTPDPALLSARIVDVTFGIPTDGTRKTFIRISYQNLQAGIATANMELLGYIH